MMARRPRTSVTMPSSTTRVPSAMPAIRRRPRKTAVSAPLPSPTVISRLATSAQGCTRSAWTRPATVTRLRQRTSPIGSTPRRAISPRRAVSARVRSLRRASAAFSVRCSRLTATAAWRPACSSRSRSTDRIARPGSGRAVSVRPCPTSCRGGACGCAVPWWCGSGGTGTNVTLAWATSPRPLAIESAVRSCRSRCQAERYSRRGMSTDTSVSPSAASSVTSCSTARETRRSGHSRISRGSRSRGRRVHSSASSAACCSSTATWTARRSSGVSARAYCRARAAVLSSRSTRTTTECRRRIGASTASRASS